VSRLVRGPIDVAGALSEVAGLALGGTALFVGSVRQGPDDGPVIEIEYSAYEEMAEAEIERILVETRSRWPDARLAVAHRLGTIPCGEPSVVVAAATPHRAEAFAACEYVIEQLKRRVPIWKRERLDDGGQRWRANRLTEKPAR
jgi:molybdopterin synthase catalytic subunit